MPSYSSAVALQIGNAGQITTTTRISRVSGHRLHCDIYATNTVIPGFTVEPLALYDVLDTAYLLLFHCARCYRVASVNRMWASARSLPGRAIRGLYGTADAWTGSSGQVRLSRLQDQTYTIRHIVFVVSSRVGVVRSLRFLRGLHRGVHDVLTV